jgi:hypothetical protein
MEIPSLTEAILDNLELLPAEKFEGAIRNESHEDRHNIQDLELMCDYTLSPDWWCEALVSRTSFPWLWDLGFSMTRQKQQSGRWNWELLVRQLSRTEIHEPDDTTLKLPLQLRNRWRIWRLFNEARVDDIAEPEGKRIEASREEKRKQLASMPMVVWPSPPGFPGFGKVKFPPRQP